MTMLVNQTPRTSPCSTRTWTIWIGIRDQVILIKCHPLISMHNRKPLCYNINSICTLVPSSMHSPMHTSIHSPMHSSSYSPAHSTVSSYSDRDRDRDHSGITPFPGRGSHTSEHRLSTGSFRGMERNQQFNDDVFFELMEMDKVAFGQPFTCQLQIQVTLDWLLPIT